MDSQTIIRRTKKWLLDVVIGLNLCPFAKKEFDQGKVRFFVSESSTTEGLMTDLYSEMMYLKSNEEVETTLLIHPSVLNLFHEYNDFLEIVEFFLEDTELNIVFQVASFHPYYQFADAEEDDVTNYTNRSPYPMLHILRERSLDRVIDLHPDTSLIPERNQNLLREMGTPAVKSLLQKCLLS